MGCGDGAAKSGHGDGDVCYGDGGDAEEGSGGGSGGVEAEAIFPRGSVSAAVR